MTTCAISNTQSDRFEKLPLQVQEELKGFLSSIAEMPLFKPDGNPKGEWKAFYASSLDSARSSACNAWRSASMTRTWTEPMGAAWSASKTFASKESRVSEWDAAWDAAMDAVANKLKGDGVNPEWDGAKDAARSAGLLAGLMVVSDLNFKGKERFIRLAREEMDVWKKGYCLHGRVDDVLYVYAKGKRPAVEQDVPERRNDELVIPKGAVLEIRTEDGGTLRIHGGTIARLRRQ